MWRVEEGGMITGSTIEQKGGGEDRESFHNFFRSA